MIVVSVSLTVGSFWVRLALRSEGLIGWSVSLEEKRQLFHCSFDILLMTAANGEIPVMKRPKLYLNNKPERRNRETYKTLNLDRTNLRTFTFNLLILISFEMAEKTTC